MVQPSSRREGFSTIPNVKWEDVGGLDFLRQEFDRYIVRRIKFPEEYAEFGVDLETGFLLYGPPGCGKTLIAKAVANEAGANFIHIKGPELLNKYVGESELAVRTLFSRARTCSPCILFFDELLIELDGSDQRRGVYVIGATNRPEVMDRAVLRPGRFGKFLYVPLPSPDERGLILKALARQKPIDADVDLSAIGRTEACDNLSGADLSALMNEAAMGALEEKLTSTGISEASWTIKTLHFEHALNKISPSVSDKQKQFYKALSESFKAG
ncbi:Cell division control protein 48-like protein C [Hibiscus syriacus]|uniref:Cell division control protein 48-like protein C n=1 Tax=Hibiscus syriacus TaxID=106335 RepID=A0A6A2ZNC6_HIBSY|nr:Cell division control protein 48-like protein C [Hibiscus syriacus]